MMLTLHGQRPLSVLPVVHRIGLLLRMGSAWRIEV